ncbi:hypothetical protein Tco_1081352 [Tanacetum coccineum]|uniref:Uncharacterized protein n=1 Tax=Tanacetum coccineum TaxID=301880 RepID=A0ABQ5HXB5_9ASTR
MTSDGPLVFDAQRVLDKIDVGPLVLQMIIDVMKVNRIVEQLVIIIDDTKIDWRSMKESCRKAHLLEDKQIPSVGIFDEHLGSIWRKITSWRRRQNSSMTPSGSTSDDVNLFCDGVTIADKKNPLEDSER